MCSSLISALLLVQPNEEDVSAVHKQFYNALEALWHKHQPSYPVYKDVKLVMQDSLGLG